MTLLYTWSPVEGAFCTVWVVFYSVYLHVICHRVEALRAGRAAATEANLKLLRYSDKNKGITDGGAVALRRLLYLSISFTGFMRSTRNDWFGLQVSLEKEAQFDGSL